MSDENVTEIEELENQTADLPDDSGDGSARVRRPMIAAVILVCAALIAVYFFIERRQAGKTDSSPAAAAAESKEEVVVSVKAARAVKENLAPEFTAVGTVAPAETATVAASISAQITAMRLLKNGFVKQGEVVAVLAARDLAAQRREAVAALEEAKLNLETLEKVTIPQTSAQNTRELADARANADNARATYARRKDLYEKGGLSLKELEASDLARQNAENALKLAEQNSKLNSSAVNPNARAVAENKIAQARERVNSIDVQANLAEVRAPISGVVTEQFQFEGEYAAAGARLLTISATGSVIVKAAFADTVVAALREGNSVTAFLPAAPDERFAGRITTIARAADPASRTIEVWANFANDRGLLRVGDSVRFVVDGNPRNDAVTIPSAAVTLEATNADEGVVMTIDKDNVAHEKKVKVGIRRGDKIQIVEGLEGGELVVTEGNYALPDGTKVEIAKDEEQAEGEK